jgi:hypothetical protein
MKKASAIVAMVMVLLVHAVAACTLQPTQTPAPPETLSLTSSSLSMQTTTSVILPTSTEAPSYLTLGTPVDVDGDYEFTLKDVHCAEVLAPSNPAGVYTAYRPTSQDYFLVGVVSVRNLQDSSGDTGLDAEMVVLCGDTTYDSTAVFESEDGSALEVPMVSGAISVAPLAERMVYFAAPVPHDIKDGNTLDVTFTVNGIDYTYVYKTGPKQYLELGKPVVGFAEDPLRKFEITLEELDTAELTGYGPFTIDRTSDSPNAVVGVVTLKTYETGVQLIYSAKLTMVYNDEKYEMSIFRENGDGTGTYIIDGDPMVGRDTTEQFLYVGTSSFEEVWEKGKSVTIILEVRYTNHYYDFTL